MSCLAENNPTHWWWLVEVYVPTLPMLDSLFDPLSTVGATRRSTGSRYLGPAPSATHPPPQGAWIPCCIEDSPRLPACPLQNTDRRKVTLDRFLPCRDPSLCASSPGGPVGWRHRLASRIPPGRSPPRPPRDELLVVPVL